jgi:hypothetical protein
MIYPSNFLYPYLFLSTSRLSRNLLHLIAGIQNECGIIASNQISYSFGDQKYFFLFQMKNCDASNNVAKYNKIRQENQMEKHLVKRLCFVCTKKYIFSLVHPEK